MGKDEERVLQQRAVKAAHLKAWASLGSQASPHPEPKPLLHRCWFSCKPS